MIIKEHISEFLTPLKPSDTAQFALLMMEDFCVRDLPMVVNSQILGNIKASDLIDQNPTLTLDKIKPSNIFIINVNHSFFKALRLFSESGYDTLAVEDQLEFVGILAQRKLISAMGIGLSAQHEGAVLLLSCSIQDYSLSQLARMAELEGGSVFGVWTQFNVDRGVLDVLLKLSFINVDHLIYSLEQNGYEVKHKVNHGNKELLEERYSALMKYLDI
ncbi:MAG: CBS domain-containing protein [Bacteroidia bacterium]|jgi:CBS domain-containing protein